MDSDVVKLDDILSKDLVLTVKKNGMNGRLCHVGTPFGECSFLVSIPMPCNFCQELSNQPGMLSSCLTTPNTYRNNLNCCIVTF